MIVVYDCAPRAEVDTTQPLRWSAEHSEARWFEVAALDGIEMPEPYKTLDPRR